MCKFIYLFTRTANFLDVKSSQNTSINFKTSLQGKNSITWFQWADCIMWAMCSILSGLDNFD